MKTYTEQKEFDKDIKNNVFISDENVELKFDLFTKASLEIEGDINARNIRAEDISARDINAGDISARDISANDISARDISARMLTYYAVAFAYKSMTVESIKGRRENSKHFALDGEIKLLEKD